MKSQGKKCWEIKNCSRDERRSCPAFKFNKNCWEVMDKEPKVQCADFLKNCVDEKCPVFMEYASEITAAWIKYCKSRKI